MGHNFTKSRDIVYRGLFVVRVFRDVQSSFVSEDIRAQAAMSLLNYPKHLYKIRHFGPNVGGGGERPKFSNLAHFYHSKVWLN